MIGLWKYPGWATYVLVWRANCITTATSIQGFGVNKTALRMLVHLRQESMSYSRSDWSAKSSEHVGQQADQTDLPLISLQSRKADQTDLPTITTSHHTFLVINKKWTWVASNECFAHSKCTMAPKGDYYLKNVENKQGRHDVNTSLQPRLSTRL